MSFERALAFTLPYEGGLINDPNDPGGLTNFGISQRSYPSLDIKNLTIEDAKAIYERDFWKAACCDQLPENIGIAVFDTAVNQGVGVAVRLLQLAVGVDVDGNVGPKTIGAAFRAGDNGAWMFLIHRGKQYMKTKGIEVWGNNWGQRLVELANFIFQGPDREGWPSR